MNANHEKDCLLKGKLFTEEKDAFFFMLTNKVICLTKICPFCEKEASLRQSKIFSNELCYYCNNCYKRFSMNKDEIYQRSELTKKHCSRNNFHVGQTGIFRLHFQANLSFQKDYYHKLCPRRLNYLYGQMISVQWF